MARNGSGTYNRAVSPYTAGTTITAATVNSEMDDIATALTGSMARDGQSPAQANIPMGGFRLTGLANAIASTDAAALGQVAALAGATMTGALGVTAGTAASPGVFVSGDTNTGLFQPSADTLAVTVGGAEVARFGANGLQSAAPWVDLASATTTDLGAQTSSNLRITGTTTITGLGTIASGTVRNLRFADALTLTHNGTSLILPGAANIITAAGDTATAISLGSGNWVVTAFQRALNAPLVFSVTGASLITAADAAAARSAISVSDQWVQISSANITAVNAIDVTWTGGAYLDYKILLLGARPAAGTANDMMLLVRRNGSFLSGASDYNTQYTWWNGATGTASAAAASYHTLTANGIAAEPSRCEIALMQAANTERIVVDARCRYTSNTPAHSSALFTSNIVNGSGWLDGARLQFVGGATNFAAVGKIVVLGMKS